MQVLVSEVYAVAGEVLAAGYEARVLGGVEKSCAFLSTLSGSEPKVRVLVMGLRKFMSMSTTGEKVQFMPAARP